MSTAVRKFLRRNVVGLTALFVALGGTALALERNSVRSKHIVNGQVKAKDTNTSQVQARVDGNCPPGLSIREIANDGDVTCETVGGGGSPTGPAGGDLLGSSYPNPLIAPGVVGTSEIGSSGVGKSELASNTVGSEELLAINEYSTTQPIAANTFTTVTTLCPAGEQIITGGFDTKGASQTGIPALISRRAPGGWSVTVFTQITTTPPLTVYAYCLDP